MSTTTELQNWLNGTPTGGPNGDGRYPMTAKDGTVFLVYCPAAQALNPALAEQPVEIFAEQAQAAATNSAASASTAEAARIAAAGSAASAASNASAAASSATAATNSANTAGNSATAAATSATAAAGSATTANTARTNAELARDKAQMWADHPVDTVVETGKYSSKHWAQKAADSVSTGHTHTASQISDSTAAGRALLTAANAAAQRTALDTGGLNTINTWNAGQVFGGAAGSEGGQFDFHAPVTGSSFGSNISVDVQGNDVRFFAMWAGQVRGYKLNFANATDGQILDVLSTRNYATANTWTGTNTYTQNVTIGDGTTTRNLTVQGATSGANSGAFVGARLGSTGFVYPGVIGNRSAIIGGAHSPQGILWSAGTGLPFDVVCAEGLTVNGNTVWHAGNFDPNTKFNTTGGTMTGDLVINKGIPQIQLLSPSGATAAGKGYRLFTNISDANDFGLNFERWNGSAWTTAFRYQDSSLHLAGWLWSRSGAVGTQAFHHAMSWDNAVIRAATVLEPDAAYSIYEYTAAGGVPTNGTHKLRISQDARFQNNASDAIYYGGNRVLDVSFSVPVAAGARTGQQAIWNQASGRAEFLDTAIHHIDWNTATESGWWMGGGAANAPATMQWFIGHVLRHNGDWIVQEVWDFTQGARAVRWRRNRLNGVWQPWEQEAPVAGSARFGPATSDVQFAASTVSGSFGGGVVMRDGSVWTGMWTQNDSSMRFGIGGSGGLTERMRINSQGFVEGFGGAGAQPGFAASENGVRRWAWYYAGGVGDQCRLAVYDAGGSYTGDALIIERTTREVSDWRGSIRDTPVNAQAGNYTFTANDRGRKVLKTATSHVTYTLPAGLPIGTTIIVRNKRASGNITIARSGTILRTAGSGTDANRTIAPWGEAVLHHEEATEEWVISGTGVS